jgi:signal transduction histidine kinase
LRLVYTAPILVSVSTPRADADKRRANRPGSGLYFGVLALALLSCMLILGLVVWQAFRERAERIEREKDALARMAEVVATDTADMFGRIRFFFETADYWLGQKPDADPRFDPDFRRLVDGFRASMGNRVDIRLVSETGGLYYIPSKTEKPLADVTDRDYFKAQLAPATRGFHVADPVLSRVTGKWGIPISYPLSRRAGGIDIIFAAIEMPVLDELYDKIRPKPKGSISLIRGDGVIMARSPFVGNLLGTTIAPDTAGWRSAVKAAPQGVWVMHTRTDDEDRILAFKNIDNPDLVVSVSARLGDVLAAWSADLWWRALIAALMVVAIVTIASRLLFVLKRLGDAQAELASNMERLRRSDATKDKLFSVIAHDLRGPIGGITSLLETLSTDRADLSDEEIGEFIDALGAASRNTSQLLENLLAWSRSQRGDLPFRPERILVYPIIEECVDVFGLSALEKGIAVEFSIENGLEARADPEQLKTLVRNLTSNAVKFSSRGGRVLIKASRADGGARIEVRDEGIGMEKAQVDALYDFGTLRSRPGTANERGSGLGFMLCKEIVDNHGGRIEVTSEVGAGSAITVFLPDERDAGEDPAGKR